ncbi:hypothetical protein KSP40_PGU014228 [Platanthera guangdongensis]|uniref:Uncharacterized protein n=1 Tax=Platanthera guangdongensis TaxID=2320717 RepID=A0ABR2MHU0_9ASPA
MDREKFIVQELMCEVESMMWNTEVAVRSYMIVRPIFLRPNAANTSDGATPSSFFFGATPSSSPLNQLSSSSMVPHYDFYSGFSKRPSPFLQFSLSRFEKYIAECCQWIEELEQLLLLDSEKNSSSSGSTSLQSLPNIISNDHDFFVHVAAKVRLTKSDIALRPHLHMHSYYYMRLFSECTYASIAAL